MAKQSHQTMTYEREYRDVLDRLRRENGTVCSLDYFLNTAEQWFAETRRTLQLTVLGLGVPEELICAAGAVPRIVLGGSLKAAAWSDDLVPQDTDPVSRSVLGFLQVFAQPGTQAPGCPSQLPGAVGHGVGYGVSPCGPLLMMLGYAATVPLSCALAVGAVFALCSAISPMLLLLLLSGALAGRMYREIPQYLSWFRLGCYILLVIFFAAELGSVL